MNMCVCARTRTHLADVHLNLGTTVIPMLVLIYNILFGWLAIVGFENKSRCKSTFIGLNSNNFDSLHLYSFALLNLT